MSNDIIIGNNGRVGWRPKPRQEYPIVKSFVHKGYVFLLSVVPTFTGTAAMWSHHQFEGSVALPLEEYKKLFQLEHNRQIEALIWKDLLSEPEEFRNQTVEQVSNPLIES